MSDRPNYPNQIGDALARALDPEADMAKRAIWRKLAGVLNGVFDPKAIDVLEDPTAVEAYMPDGKWCWAKTTAWQLDPATGYPLALWLKTSDASKDWEKIWPAVATSDHKVAIDGEDEAAGGADYADTKIVVGPGGSVIKTTGSHGKALAIGVDLSDLDPLPDAAEAEPGTSNKLSRADHVHPLTRPAKIRYYLSDAPGADGGHLLVTSNPYDETNAVDFEGASEWEVFISAAGSPEVAEWQGGNVHAHLRIKLINPQAGRTYKLYTGNGDIVYTDMIWEYTHGDRYQIRESAPSQPSITTDYATLDFDIPVSALAAGTDGRLGLNMRMRVYVGSSEDVFAGEKIVIRIGGDNASYLDTLFTPDGGFSGVHNDLDGRNADNAHPFAAITPGRVQTPANAPVTSVDGLFAVPLNSNFVVLDGEEDLIGCSTEGWTGPGWIEVHILNERDILKSQSPLPAGYAPFMWGSTDTGYGAAYDVQTAYAGSIFRFRWTGGVWRIAGVMNM